MKLFEELKGHNTYVRDDCLVVKVKDKQTASHLRNRFELRGYAADLEKNNNEYVIWIWGSQLMDKYLLKETNCCAA